MSNLFTLLGQSVVKPPLVPDQTWEILLDAIACIGGGEAPLSSIVGNLVKDGWWPRLANGLRGDQGVIMDHRGRIHGFSEDPDVFMLE